MHNLKSLDDYHAYLARIHPVIWSELKKFGDETGWSANKSINLALADLLDIDISL